MKTWGIKSRVIFLSLLPASLSAVMLGLYLMNAQISFLESAVHERGQAIARQLAPACEYGVFAGNRAILESLARAALHETDVRSVTIMDEAGKPLASAGKLAQSLAPPSRQTPAMSTARLDNLLSITAPIYHSRVVMEDYIGEAATGEAPRAARQPVLGWVNIELSLESTTAQKNRIIVSSLLITLFGLAIAAVLGRYMARGVSDPILHLADTVRQLGEGKLETRARTDNRGEIQVLESGINTMAARLQEAQDRLQERVDQATAELRTTLDQL